jgi:hypothetical protein
MEPLIHRAGGVVGAASNFVVVLDDNTATTMELATATTQQRQNIY